MNHLAYLSLGSNLGNRANHLQEAIERLATLGTVIAISSMYETEPVDFTAQPWFLNCTVALQTCRGPEPLLEGLLTIEREMGRERIPEQSKGPRTIDLDILLFDEIALDTARLTIPHPAMHQRRFVLEPLAEIAPQARHPRIERTIQQLLEALPPGQAVHRFEPKPPVNAEV